MVTLDLHKNKIAIVGPPNVGKSSLFNKFGRGYSVVANYPQTTIETFRKDAVFSGQRFELIDTPGLFSLYAVTEDEAVARAVLLNEHPELVIFCGDATNIKRTLVLLSQVLELELPTIFCLNKMDEAGRKGISVDTAVISDEIGTPVILTAAIEGAGLKELGEAVEKTSSAQWSTRFSGAIENALEQMKTVFPEGERPSRGLLLMLLLDETAAAAAIGKRYGHECLNGAVEMRRRFYEATTPAQVIKSVFDTREKWAASLVDRAVKVHRSEKRSIAANLARLSRHPFYGIPILFGVLWATFYAVGHISTALAAFVDGLIFAPAAGFIGSLVSNQVFREFLVGDFGIITMGVFNAVGTVVPILLVFFLITNLLEEIGYLPNLGVLLNRMLAPMGLSGKAVLPMVLGFGCNTIATLASRMLETKKERIVASFLIALGFPCAVQLGILLAILATAPFSALLIVIGSITATQIIVGLLLNRLIPTKKHADFIMDLPTFYTPDWRNIVRKTYFRIRWFLEEAIPLFTAAALLMFILQKSGLLMLIENAARPLVSGFLSLPEKAAEVFILVLARREIGALHFRDMVDSGALDYTQTVVGLIVVTLFIPCVSNTMVMIKELGIRWALSINAAIIVIAVMVGGLVNALMRLA